VGSTIDTLTIDCADPTRVAAFWCSALGYELVESDAEVAEIRDPSGAGWPLLFQVVPEGKSVKNRLHLDIRASASMAAEVERLKGFGATEQRFVEEGDSFWTIMLDVEGNEFCVLRGPEDGWAPDA
jgi:catechol 2,3-dioxygenase-like lactoylglutathione lyase family enzyme